MNEPDDFDKRRHDRHDYRERVYFDFIYDFQAKVEFEPHSDKHSGASRKRHCGMTRNVSTQGLCFTSDVEVSPHSVLDIHVYVQGRADPVQLQGEARWVKLTTVDSHGNKHFEVGVHLTVVNNRPVQNTIHFDDKYRVYWSDVLESLLGEFRKYYQP